MNFRAMVDAFLVYSCFLLGHHEWFVPVQNVFFHSAIYDNKDSACGNLMGFQQLHQFVYMQSEIWREIDGAKHIPIVFLLALLR